MKYVKNLNVWIHFAFLFVLKYKFVDKNCIRFTNCTRMLETIDYEMRPRRDRWLAERFDFFFIFTILF